MFGFLEISGLVLGGLLLLLLLVAAVYNCSRRRRREGKEEEEVEDLSDSDNSLHWDTVSMEMKGSTLNGSR